MGHEVVSRRSSLVGQNGVEEPRSSAVQEIQRATGDGRRGTGIDELEAGSWELTASPGRVFGLIGPAGSGLTSMGISMVAAGTTTEPVAVLDLRGWFCPSLAWERGIGPEQLVVIRCRDTKVWPRLMATLVEGFPAVYAEVPRRVPAHALRRLGALVRSRRTTAVLRAMDGDLPTGLLHLRIEGVAIHWDGSGAGHGRLQRRAVTVRASGKGARGIERELVVEDDGANSLRLVPGLAVAPAGRAIG